MSTKAAKKTQAKKATKRISRKKSTPFTEDYTRMAAIGIISSVQGALEDKNQLGAVCRLLMSKMDNMAKLYANPKQYSIFQPEHRSISRIVRELTK